VWKRMMNLRERKLIKILDLYLDWKGLHDLSPIHKNCIIYDFVEFNCWSKTFNLGPTWAIRPTPSGIGLKVVCKIFIEYIVDILQVYPSYLIVFPNMITNDISLLLLLSLYYIIILFLINLITNLQYYYFITYWWWLVS